MRQPGPPSGRPGHRRAHPWHRVHREPAPADLEVQVGALERAGVPHRAHHLAGGRPAPPPGAARSARCAYMVWYPSPWSSDRRGSRSRASHPRQATVPAADRLHRRAAGARMSRPFCTVTVLKLGFTTFRRPPRRARQRATAAFLAARRSRWAPAPPAPRPPPAAAPVSASSASTDPAARAFAWQELQGSPSSVCWPAASSASARSSTRRLAQSRRFQASSCSRRVRWKSTTDASRRAPRGRSRTSEERARARQTRAAKSSAGSSTSSGLRCGQPVERAEPRAEPLHPRLEHRAGQGLLGARRRRAGLRAPSAGCEIAAARAADTRASPAYTENAASASRTGRGANAAAPAGSRADPTRRQPRRPARRTRRGARRRGSRRCLIRAGTGRPRGSCPPDPARAPASAARAACIHGERRPQCPAAGGRESRLASCGETAGGRRSAPAMASAAPASPWRPPSMRKGAWTKRSVAPTSFWISISSRRA